jgi:hypothetical protein
MDHSVRSKIELAMTNFIINPFGKTALSIHTITDIVPEAFTQHPKTCEREVQPNDLHFVINIYNGQPFIKLQVPVAISFKGYGDIMPIHKSPQGGVYDPYCLMGLYEKKIHLNTNISAQVNAFVDEAYKSYKIVAYKTAKVFPIN